MTIDLPLTPEDVNEIAAILDGSSYDRLDIRTSRLRLRVQRSDGGWTQQWSIAEDAGVEADIVAAAGAIVIEALPDGVEGIPAPLPGTFYRAPQPGAPPFVEVGDVVGPESVVGIVETMKLMNPVHAGCAGRVTAICVDNATMVDGGAVLMHVEPA
jgi:acetyl-CoA carboxylase biotin carboxyl carrier protein